MVGVLAGGLLIACASDSTKAPELYGWRSAGLVLRDADRTGGLHKLVNIGNTLFAMDAYLTDSAGTKERPYRWRIWKTTTGSMQWEVLSVPTKGVPYLWATDGQYLYVGMRYTGDVLRYDPTLGNWKTIRLPDPPASEAGVWDVYTLGLFAGELVVGISPIDTNTSYCWIGGIRDSVGKKIPCVGRLKNIPLDQVLEYQGMLYGISSRHGVYRWALGADTWELLRSPRGRTDSSELELVSAIGIHNGHLYVGYARNWDGIYRWNGDGTWTSMTPKPDDGRDIRETPRDVRVLTSYRGRLYMAGVAGSSVKMWAPKDTAKPAFGDWRLIDNGWCSIPDYGCGSQNWGIVGIGDTLYSTGWGFVAKCPIADFEKMARPLYKQP